MKDQNIPDGWQMVKFGDIAKQSKESVDRDNNPYDYYIEGGHMDTEDMRIRRFGVFSEDYVGPAFHRVFRKGQILYGSRRTYLKKVAKADFDGITANTTFVINSSTTSFFEKKLLPYLMLSDSFTKHSVLNSKGSTNPYINWSDIEGFQFPCPGVEEQKKVLSSLEHIDSIEEGYRGAIENAEKLLKLIQVKYFKNYFDSNERKRSELPLGWEEYEMGKILLESPSSGKSISEVDRVTGFFVLSLNCLTKYGFENNGYKSIEEKDLLESCRMRSGDLLISRANTTDLVGLVGVYEDKLERDAIFPDTMWRLTVDEGLVLKEFLKNYLLSPYARRQVQKIAAGTSGSMKKINKASFSKIKVPVPPKEEQLLINNAIEELYATLKVLKLKVDDLKKLRLSMVNDFFKMEL